MNKVVLDASVLMALLNAEPGTKIFTSRPRLLASAVISAVNLGEVYSKLISLGADPDEAWEAACAPVPEIVPFDTKQAEIIGRLIPLTRSRGLSLGDRACLALGAALKAPVFTTDRAWKGLPVGAEIHVIR